MVSPGVAQTSCSAIGEDPQSPRSPWGIPCPGPCSPARLPGAHAAAAVGSNFIVEGKMKEISSKKISGCEYLKKPFLKLQLPGKRTNYHFRDRHTWRIRALGNNQKNIFTGVHYLY